MTDLELKVPPSPAINIDVSKQMQEEEKDKNGIVGTALTFVSIIVGGGVVSVPYAYTSAGITVGLGCQFIVMLVMLYSASLYLTSKKRLKCQSAFTVVAQQCIGDLSSLLINGIIVFCIFGVLILYFILFARITLSLLHYD